MKKIRKEQKESFEPKQQKSPSSDPNSRYY